MNETIGSRIAAARKQAGYTQEELAEKLGVSGQAVSKWENDLSCPDITLLPNLARLLNTTVDALLSGQAPQAAIVPEAQRKDLSEMMLRVRVTSGDGDHVKINVPMSLLKVALDMGMQMPQLSGNDALKGIDFNQIFRLVEKGAIGKLVDIETGEGDYIEVVVE